MNQEDRFKFYEDIYFREIERIEKISARLSLPFGVLLAVSAILAFMLNANEKPIVSPWKEIFWVFFAFSSIALSVGAWFLRMAWFGHYDKLMPTADAIENYHSTLRNTYAEYEGADKLTEKSFNNFLFNYYIQFASENAINNDRRSFNIYRALVSFTVAILLSLGAAFPFYFGTNNFEGNLNVGQKTTSTATSSTTTAQCSREYPETVESTPAASVNQSPDAEKMSPNKSLQPTAKASAE